LQLFVQFGRHGRFNFSVSEITLFQLYMRFCQLIGQIDDLPAEQGGLAIILAQLLMDYLGFRLLLR
jgi:hypothetical protein